MQVELNSLLPSTLIEIGVCVLVGLSVGLVCVHARPLLVSLVHAVKLFTVKRGDDMVVIFSIDAFAHNELLAGRVAGCAVLGSAASLSNEKSVMF